MARRWGKIVTLERDSEAPLMSIRRLSKVYRDGNKRLVAIDALDLDIYRGEILGLVGESGCGKSTLARTLLRLEEPTTGTIQFDGQDLLALNRQELKRVRRDIQMVFQNPYGSLNPRLTVGDIVGEAIDLHKLAGNKEARTQQVVELLRLVGLDPEVMGRYPHEFSGGQRQRIGIARALASKPKLLICDEPISALDISIQAQVVNLLKKLRQEMDLTYLFIAHDLSMVRYLSTRVGVMYLGHLVELAPTDVLFNNPLHPYTQALLASRPLPDPELERKRKAPPLHGEVPSALNPPSGCVFRTRCPKVMEGCAHHSAYLEEKEPGHWVACHLF